MDRRDSIKSLLAGTLASGLLLNGCKPGSPEAIEKENNVLGDYGRTPEEKSRDEKLMKETYFNDHELGTIATLCDIILPASDSFGSATDAEVPEFIAFIVKDLTDHQLPMRGGLMWLDNYANGLYNTEFASCTLEQQISIVDAIAYPDKSTPETEQGIAFFNRMRNLTLTGYYTSEMGLKDLGYAGNRPNVWDGVPEDVLKDHDVEYDPEWLAKCVDQSKRDVVAEWDEDGNLLT